MLNTKIVSSIGMELKVDQSICELFERQVDRTPDAVAIICEGRTLTYRELEKHVTQLARHLRKHYQIGPESIVALLLGRSERMLISMLGVLKAGGAYLPISPDYPASRVSYLLQDACPSLLLTEQQHAPFFERFTEKRLLWNQDVEWSNESSDRLSDNPDLHQLLYVIYTSGSTGEPKGVMMEHGNLSNFIVWCGEEYHDSVFDVVYAVTPYSFDLSNIELFFPLTVGRKIRLLPTSQVMGLYLKRDRNVLINTVPSLVQEMIKTDNIFENVSVLNLGGEAVPPSLGRALRSYPKMEIRNMYGPTETTSTAINYRLDLAASDRILIGKPISNTVVYILDEKLRSVAIGVKGEICIGGRGLGRGYLNRPEMTRERFVNDPYRRGKRLYRTGDKGIYLPDGNISYQGRTDNQVKLKGFRVELDEISNHLVSHTDLGDAIVGVIRTIGGDRLVAVVRPLSDNLIAEELTEFLRERLPSFMIPDEVIFVDSLPLTPTGKIDRQALFFQELRQHAGEP